MDSRCGGGSPGYFFITVRKNDVGGRFHERSYKNCYTAGTPDYCHGWLGQTDKFEFLNFSGFPPGQSMTAVGRLARL